MEFTPLRYNPHCPHGIDKSVSLITAGTIVFRNFAIKIEHESDANDCMGTVPRGTGLDSRKPTDKEDHASTDSS